MDAHSCLPLARAQHGPECELQDVTDGRADYAEGIEGALLRGEKEERV